MSPKLAKLFLESKDAYFKTLGTMTNLLTRLAIIISIIVTISSNSIIGVFFGANYLAAADALVIHIWSSVFVFCGTAVSPWIIHERVSFMAIWPPVIGAIVNIILNYILIPQYGAIGCSLATLIAYAISSWIANSLFSITRPIFILQTKAITGINLK
jgi:PST family polysaccharide transporter